MEADLSEARAFAADLGRAAGAVVPVAREVVKKAAQNVKNDTRTAVSTHPTWKRLASTVNYDMYGLAAEVGYDDKGQGELAGIYEFGSSRRAPHPTLIPAAQSEAVRFEPALSKAIGDLL